MEHSFDIDIAKEYGLNEAIILKNLWFWIEKNRANNKHFHDGAYWTYNSTKAFNELFPYLSQRQIQNTLKKLKDKEIIQTGNYNKSSYDRTLWYAFTKKGECIMQKCKMEDAEKGNGNGENVKPIPDIITDNKTHIVNTDENTQQAESVFDSEDDREEKILKEEFEGLWSLYPKKVGKTEAYNTYKKYRTSIGENYITKGDVLKGLLAYKKQIAHTDSRYIKNGSTWFISKGWEDTYEIDDGINYDEFYDDV